MALYRHMAPKDHRFTTILVGLSNSATLFRTLPLGKCRSQRKQMETHGKLQLCSKIHFFLRWEKIDGLFFFSPFFLRFIVSIGFRDTCILPHLHVWDPVTYGRYEASFWLVFEYHSALQFLVCFLCFFSPVFFLFLWFY